MSSTLKKIQFSGNQLLMKELQRTVAFRAYNTLLTSGASQTVKSLQSNIHKLYFGDDSDPDSIGFCDQLLKGCSAFAPLFDRIKGSDTNEVQLLMKNRFHCLDTDIFVSKQPRDKGISANVLGSKGITNPVQLSPRTIWDHAKLVEKNGKKALAMLYQSEYADYARTGVPPSGKSYDDYLVFIREQMFKELSTSIIDVDDDDDNGSSDGINEKSNTEDDEKGSADKNDNRMKENWIFPGFIAFALWGPIRPNDMDDCYRAEIFFPQEETRKKGGGRNATRGKPKKDETPSSQSSVAAGNEYWLDALRKEQQTTRKMFDVNKSIEFKLVSFKEKISIAEREVDRWKSLIIPGSTLDDTNVAFVKFEQANNKLHDAEKEFDVFVSKIDEIKRGQMENESEPTEQMVTPHQRKRARAETPMSSIDILMDKEDNASL